MAKARHGPFSPANSTDDYIVESSSSETTDSADKIHTENASGSSSIIPPPPDGGYGWVCVLGQFLVNGFTWGIVASYSVYLAWYLSHSIFPAATAIDFAFIGGLNFSIAVLVAPPATFLMRSVGPRPIMSAGVVLLPAGFIGASFSRETWQLYLSQGVCVGAGVGLIYMPSSTIVPQWFLKKRSLANGICAAGSGIGGLAVCFATQAMLERIGLAWTLRVTGVVAFVFNAVAVMLMRSRNDEIRPSFRMFDWALLRNYHVALLLAWSFVTMFGYITLMFSLSDYANAIGESGDNVALVPAMLNLGAAFGRPLIGFASDRFGRIKVAGLLTFVCSVLVFAMWLPSTTFAPLVAFAFLSGAILGIFWSVIAPLAAEIGGLKHLPALLSLVWLSVSLPLTFSEVIALQLRRQNILGARSYLYPEVFAGVSYLLGSLIMVELWRSTRTKGEQRFNNGMP